MAKRARMFLCPWIWQCRPPQLSFPWLSCWAAALHGTWWAPGTWGPSAPRTALLGQGMFAGVTETPMQVEKGLRWVGQQNICSGPPAKKPGLAMRFAAPRWGQSAEPKSAKTSFKWQKYSCVVADVDRAGLELSLTAAEEALGCCSCSHTQFCQPAATSKLQNASFHCAVEAKSWEIFHESRIFKMLLGEKWSAFDFEHCLEKFPLRNLEVKYIVRLKVAPSWKSKVFVWKKLQSGCFEFGKCFFQENIKNKYIL